MKIIAGLGNPGDRYKNTRHNAGIVLADAIHKSQITNYKDNYGWRTKKDVFTAEYPDLILVKTAGVFMNESGRMMHNFLLNSPSLTKEGVSKYANLFVAHDDLDLKLGSYKIQFGTGPKEHHGLQSIEAALKTDQFWRIRIGIDNRQTPVDGETYVLQPFTREEKKVLDEVCERVIKDLFPENKI